MFTYNSKINVTVNEALSLNQLHNFLFIQNSFFSAPQKVFLLEKPFDMKVSTDQNFYYNQDILFKKRLALIDMKAEWESIIYEDKFNKWLSYRPHFPQIPTNIYPEAPEETFSCYNPGEYPKAL